ncbi:hypothetical protein BJ741DRAFT_592379 [Chytriomyces cf. hyalinus JEL632]|nr:hypothetical protein BJ741DRAFT_592379 [Chytriomyces cf. hyalinus JEL632]
MNPTPSTATAQLNSPPPVSNERRIIRRQTIIVQRTVSTPLVQPTVALPLKRKRGGENDLKERESVKGLQGAAKVPARLLTSVAQSWAAYSTTSLRMWMSLFNTIRTLLHPLSRLRNVREKTAFHAGSSEWSVALSLCFFLSCFFFFFDCLFAFLCPLRIQ